MDTGIFRTLDRPIICKYGGDFYGYAYEIRLGDIINIKDLCESYGAPYHNANFVGLGKDIDFAATPDVLDDYPCLLSMYDNQRYVVVRLGNELAGGWIK